MSRVSLKNFKQELRPYQEEALEKAMSVRQGSTLLLAAPTGTGKGTMQLALIKALRKKGIRAWIVTPSIEVLRGYIERCGGTARDLDGGSGRLVSLGKGLFVTTPVRLRNWLRRGRRTAGTLRKKLKPPQVLIIDEAHHAKAENITGGGLKKFCPDATFIGFTATPFRSNPDETADLQKFWGDAHHVLTIPQAIENGAWALPKWKIVPIVNDDNLAIVKGDIDADEASLLAAGPLVELIKTLDLSVPSCITLPNVKSAKELCELLAKENIAGQLVTAVTPTMERSVMYKRVQTQSSGLIKDFDHCRVSKDCINLPGPCSCSCADCKREIEVEDNRPSLLVSVRVLGEGVDLPWLRRWIDASPTLSPVSWLQKLGRITRPHASGQPEYVGTNRNLERHGYLLQGVIPRAEFKIAQEKFGGGSRGPRVSTLKAVSKLKPITVPLVGGVDGIMWAVWCPDVKGGSGFERCVLQDPTSDKVLSFKRSIDSSKEGPERLGKWVQEKNPPKKIVGFRARNLLGRCTEKQLKFWRVQAENRGFDGTVIPTRAQFFGLPALHEAKTTMRPDGKTLRPEREEKATGTTPNGDEDGEKKEAVPLDPSPVLDGYYTVVDKKPHWYRPIDGNPEKPTHRTYRLMTQSTHDAFMPGVQIMSRLKGPDNIFDYESCANYKKDPTLYRNIYVWSRFANNRMQIEDDWAVIAGMVSGEEAAKAYALQSGRCWRCNKMLTTPDSIANGIGPDCAAKLGIERQAIAEKLQAAKLEREEKEAEDFEKDSTIKEKKKEHEETKGESNIPLMKRLIMEAKPRAEIERIFFERYKLEEKLSGKEHKKSDSWKRKRIATYHKIAMDKLYAEQATLPPGAVRWY